MNAAELADRTRKMTAQLRRGALCVAIALAEMAGFELWRGPLPDRGDSFSVGVLANLLGFAGIWIGLRPAIPQEIVAPSSFLAYDSYRFLWLALGLSAVAIGAYLLDAPPGGRSGGSWLGYTLGTLAFTAMLWLMWFGVRKRSYASRGAPLRAWLSAHVYLGLALIVVMPLHSAFQFGWNVHTLALVLAALAIATGIAGIAFYSQVPTPMTRNRPGEKLDSLLEQVAGLDARCRAAAAALPDAYARAVESSIANTRIGGGLHTLLRGDRGSATRDAIDRIKGESSEMLLHADRERHLLVIEMLMLKERLLRRIARDLRYKALLDLWLLLHVPLAFAAVAAVVVHVFVVFYYR